MNDRKVTLQQIADKYGLPLERLEELIDERDNDYGIISANLERALGVQVKGGATFTKPSPSSFFPSLSYVDTVPGGMDATDVRVHENDDIQITERKMSAAAIAARIPPPEPVIAVPVIPGASVPLMIPQVHDNMTLDEAISAQQVVRDIQTAQSMESQKLAIEKASSIAYEQIRTYQEEHPDYDVAAGTPQVPTPELYERGGLSEELFGTAPEDMPALLLAQRNAPEGLDAEHAGQNQDDDHGNGEHDQGANGLGQGEHPEQ